MEYLIPAVLVLLLVAGFSAFLVINATRKSGPAAERADEGPPGIGPDDTPLGDTSQHAGRQTAEGAPAGEEREPEDERPRSERLANRDA